MTEVLGDTPEPPGCLTMHRSCRFSKLGWEDESGVEPACLTADEGVCTSALPLEPELMSCET